MSRLTLTLKNAWIAVIFHFIYITAQFYSRDVFLEVLGDEFLGVVSTLRSVLYFLNLSELGIGAAVGFSLYKPIYDQNKDKINEIIGYLGFLYKRIGLFVLIAATILLLFFPLIFEKTTVNLGIVIFLFAALVTSNLISYFFAYHAFLLEADQKGYVNVTVNQTIFVVRLVIQCLILIYLENVMLWILVEMLMPIIYIVIIRKKIRKIYPWLVIRYKTTKEIRDRNKMLLKKVKQLSFHKIGGFVSNGTDNIIIFSFINPVTVTFVSNYQMIMGNVNVLISKLFEGTNASVGNLVAENDLNSMTKVFWEMMALRFFFAGCTCVLIYLGFENLILIWLDEEKYIMSNDILLAFIIIFFILQVRQPVDSFKQAYGLYADIWAPLAQSIINLGCSIYFVIKLGVLGVFIGTIISQAIIVLIWRPYYLFTYGFNIRVWKYWAGFISHFFYLALAFGIYMLIGFPTLETHTNLLLLIFDVCKYGLVFPVIYFAILIVVSKGFKNLVKRFRVHIGNRIKKR